MRATVVLEWKAQLHHGLHLFFVIAASVISRNVANQETLDTVGPQILGQLYVAVALVAGISVALVGWLGRNVDTRQVVGTVHLGTAILMGGAFLAPKGSQEAAIAKYIAMELNAAALLLAFGLMLGARLGPREARRMAARVGAGGIAGGLLAGAVLSLGAPLLGSRTLFLVAAAFAVIPVFFLPPTKGPARSLASQPARDRADVPTLTPYGRWVAFTTLLMVATTTLIDYQFRYTAEQWFGGDQLAAFFGFVITAAGCTTVLFQLTLLDRMLDRMGLFATAMVMPIGLMIAGTAFGLAPTLLSLVIFKLVDSSANMSVQQATGGLLLAPLGVRARAVWQGRIDGLAKRGGQALMGVFLALFPWEPTRVLPIALALCAAWAVSLTVTRQRYIRLLTSMLSAPTAAEPEVQAYEGATVRLLEEQLDGASAARAAVILDLLEQAEHRAPNQLLAKIADADDDGAGALVVIDHLASLYDVAGLKEFTTSPKTMVAGAALLALDDVDPATAERAIKDLMRRENVAEELRALAAGLIADHDRDSRIWMQKYARSPNPATRLATSQALSRLSPGAPQEVGETLCLLSEDPDPEIARSSLRALGRHLTPAACDVCLRALERSAVRGAAMRALADLGQPVAEPIAEALRARINQPRVAAALIWALGQIGTSVCVAPLIKALSAAHITVRLAAAVALTVLHRRRHQVTLPLDLVESRFIPEIEYYGSMRDAALSGLPTTPAGKLLRRTLRQRGQASLETLFRLMSLRYPEDAIQAAFQAMSSRERANRQVALELLDTLLQSNVRLALAAAIGEGSRKNRARTREEILQELACAPDQFVRALAAQVLHDLGETVARGVVESTLEKEDEDTMSRATVEEILELQSLSLFSQATAEDLAEVAALVQERTIPKGITLFQEGDSADAMYLIRAGSVALSRKGQVVERLGPGDAAGIVAVLDRLPRELTAKTASYCTVLILKAGDLQQLLADRPLLMHSVFRALTASIRNQLDRVALGKRADD